MQTTQVALGTRPNTPLPFRPKDRRERSAVTTSPKTEKGWFSRRTSGVLEPCRGTIVNLRPKLRRNLKIAVGGVIDKFKRFPQNRLSIPAKVSR